MGKATQLYIKLATAATAEFAKHADIEDRGKWYWHPKLQKMRDEYKKTKKMDIPKYQKKTVKELNKTISKNKHEWGDQKFRAASGDVETWKEYKRRVIVNTVSGGLAGGLAGGFAGIPAQALRLHKKFKGKAIATPLIAAGAVIGVGAGLSTLLPGRKKIEDPGKLDTFGSQGELKFLRKEFSKPYVKGKRHIMHDWILDTNVN